MNKKYCDTVIEHIYKNVRLMSYAPVMIEMLISCYYDDFRESDVLKDLIEKVMDKPIEEIYKDINR